jgi:hypothetical protein
VLVRPATGPDVTPWAGAQVRNPGPLPIEADWDQGFRVDPGPAATTWDGHPLPPGTVVLLDGESFARLVQQSPAFLDAEAVQHGRPFVLVTGEPGVSLGVSQRDATRWAHGMYPYQRDTFAADGPVVVGESDGHAVLALPENARWHHLGFDPASSQRVLDETRVDAMLPFVARRVAQGRVAAGLREGPPVHRGEVMRVLHGLRRQGQATGTAMDFARRVAEIILATDRAVPPPAIRARSDWRPGEQMGELLRAAVTRELSVNGMAPPPLLVDSVYATYRRRWLPGHHRTHPNSRDHARAIVELGLHGRVAPPRRGAAAAAVPGPSTGGAGPSRAAARRDEGPAGARAGMPGASGDEVVVTSTGSVLSGTFPGALPPTGETLVLPGELDAGGAAVHGTAVEIMVPSGVEVVRRRGADGVRLVLPAGTVLLVEDVRFDVGRRIVELVVLPRNPRT